MYFSLDVCRIFPEIPLYLLTVGISSVLPILSSGLCCQPGHGLIGTISIQNLQEEKGRWPLPRKTRSAHDTFSLPTFPGFELQFYLLLLSFWKGNSNINKNKNFPMLAVVLLKKIQIPIFILKYVILAMISLNKREKLNT